ncbi:MAG: hypothetical protein PHH51_02685 [Bacilli bacterium]|nr:hypothetical protein [Bacilli bacterium]MDD3895944.1 hypothetical protein [Bacilli bacterium]MDD4407515.1 hypothetical protein [Bacilli bacterium]
MNSRMDKYEFDTPDYKKRTELKANLYQNNEIENYSKIDLNSNISVLKTDSKNIDIDKIREMLDKKYRDNMPRRKSIALDYETEEVKEEDDLFDTKEYDINEIIAKAKSEQSVNYLQDRLKKINNTNNDILENLNINPKSDIKKFDDEKELMSLINTITQIEIENQEKAKNEAADLLDLNQTKQIDSFTTENTFFTGNMKIQDKDYEDFKEIQKDIKSNSILIKLLVFIFIIIIIALIVFLLNDYLNLELF